MCASKAARFIDYLKENANLGAGFEMQWTSSMTAIQMSSGEAPFSHVCLGGCQVHRLFERECNPWVLAF